MTREMCVSTTGRAVMETIRSYGVNTVFGIPGTHNLELYRPLASLEIRSVTTRHEQGAGYAADGWSQRTGLPGVVITTSGPGLLNALSAAGTAYCESRPMLILAPGPPRSEAFGDRGTLHETKDQFGAASAIVERAIRPHSADDAVAAVHDAFELFANGRPRPVYIELPLDLLEESVPLPVGATTARCGESRLCADPDAIANAVALLDESERPVIIAGGGARKAAAQVLALAECLSAPVITTLNAKGLIDERHPLALGSNLRLQRVRECAESADVLVVIGSKLGPAELWADRLEARGKVIRIDRVEDQLWKNLIPDVAIHADATRALADLLPQLTGSGRPDRAAVAETVAATLREARAECCNVSPVNYRLGAAISDALPEGAIIATDSSQIAYKGLLNLHLATSPNTTLYMPTYATLGYGLPAAIGARLASPDRDTFAVVGDGALMFSVQELIVVAELGLDITVIVVDNGGYSEIEKNQNDAGIPPVGVRLRQPDWVGLVRAFGGTGRTARTADELRAAVRGALTNGGLQLIHIDERSFDATSTGPAGRER